MSLDGKRRCHKCGRTVEEVDGEQPRFQYNGDAHTHTCAECAGMAPREPTPTTPPCETRRLYAQEKRNTEVERQDNVRLTARVADLEARVAKARDKFMELRDLNPEQKKIWKRADDILAGKK